MAETIAAQEASADREMRRNALILSAAGAFLSANSAVAFILGGLAGIYLLGPDKSLATLPVTGFAVGVALGAIPAAALMRWLGRRLGFLIGTVIAMIGGIVAGFAVIEGSFALLVAGLLIVGFAGAFTQQYRFAAADGADPVFRTRAISWVLTGGIAAAVIGPQTAIWTRDLLQPIPFAGGFFAMSGLAVIGFTILLSLSGAARLPPPVASRSGGRGLPEIARQPRFIVAVLCAMGSFSLMSFVMTAAPLAIVAHGHGADNAALGIQWHVVAMYGPSFVTGTLIAKFGKERIVAVGLLLLAGCAGVALAGIGLMHFWVALVLLGLGWNFAFIGATAMVADTYRPDEKAKVEGLNDFLVFGSVAIASAASGGIFNWVGWNWLVFLMFPVLVVCALALATTFFRRERTPISGA